MADDTGTDATDDTADDLDLDDAQGADDAKGGDDKKADDKAPLTVEEWQAKYEAAARINRDLDRRTKRDKERLDRMEAAANAAAAKGKGDDDKVDAEKIREDARAEARAEVLRDRVLDKIEAKAGAKFNLDPEDVAALLLRRKDVDHFVTDGKVDAGAIDDALSELLESKPNLAAQGGSRFKGGADGGSRKGSDSKGPAQLTAADVDRMSAAHDYDGIEKARQEGRLTDLLSGKR